MTGSKYCKSRTTLPLLFLVRILICFLLCDATSDGYCENSNQDSSQCAESIVEDCKCQPHADDTDGGARIAYLISLHNERTLLQTNTLIKRIAAPGYIILIHIDKKFPKEQWMGSTSYKELMEYIDDEKCGACGATVVVESHFDCEWSHWSMMDPTLWAMDQLTTSERFKNKWDVFINISADSLPVFTPKVISQYFSNELKGINFVTSISCYTGLLPTQLDQFPERWMKRAYYSKVGNFNISYKEDDGKQKEVELILHFGSQWMTLTPEFVHYIATSMRHEESLPSKFKESFVQRKAVMSDEVFIPTLIANHAEFHATLPKLTDEGSLVSKPDMFAIRYERMDEHVPNPDLQVVEDQRYEVPKSLEGRIEQAKSWGPYYIGVYDLANIKDSGALFIRKFSQEIDPNFLHLFPVKHKDEIPYVQWPKEIQISKKIDVNDLPLMG